jgi:hypothetical protein
MPTSKPEKKEPKKPLSVTHPELAEQAVGWDPADFTAGSGMKVKWHCEKDHDWISSINSRTRKGRNDGCAICAGKQIEIGFNDLLTLRPDVAAQAYGWNPAEFTVGSAKKMKWICPNGHIFTATINSKTGKNTSQVSNGCGVCNGKTVLEGFNDLKTISPKIAIQAFGWDPTKFTAGSGMNMEWKCSTGHIWKARISDRTSKDYGCAICSGRKALAGFNDLKTTHPDLAQQAFDWDPSEFTYGSGKSVTWKCSANHKWKASISSRTNMKSGCPYCSGNSVLVGHNDLATTHPEIARTIVIGDPTLVSFGSGEIFKWICIVGHTFEMSIKERTKKNTLCPVCSGHRVLVGFNDLLTTHPEIAKLADGWNPEEVSRGSNKEKNWICESGHNWTAPIYSLTLDGTRCPICSGQQFRKGYNDLLTTHPEIAKEAFGWDPSTLGASNDKKLKWKCPLGHTYEALVYNRTFRKDQCSICSGNQVLAGFNDLVTTHPKFAKLADGWDPKKFSFGSNEKVKWVCPKGHKWKAMIATVTKSNKLGCPTCAPTGYDPNEDSFLYFLAHPDWEMLQIGITNFPNDRLGKHKNLGWELLELRGPMDGHLTQQWETAILRMLKKKGADLSNEKVAGKFDGYSEAWTKATFPVDSIKELMRLTDEFEDGQEKKQRRKLKDAK